MRISVLIPSRGRNLRLLAAVGALRDLESKRHEVTYVIGVDVDDPRTIGTCQMMQLGGQLAYRVFERQGSLGAIANQLSRDVPADVYCVLADDIFITTQDWDCRIAEAVERKPDGVFWWKCREREGREPSLAPILTHRWVEASGRIFTEHFPFWYDDLWLFEVWVLASEGEALYVDALMEDYPSATHRMRDLAFWQDFYERMRPQRVADAERIAKALGWPLTGITDHLSRALNKPNPEFVANIPRIESGQGEAAVPPTPEYVAIKGRAEKLLAGLERIAA